MSTPETKRLCLRVWNRSSSGGTRPPQIKLHEYQYTCYPKPLIYSVYSQSDMNLNNRILVIANGLLGTHFASAPVNDDAPKSSLSLVKSHKAYEQ